MKLIKESVLSEKARKKLKESKFKNSLGVEEYDDIIKYKGFSIERKFKKLFKVYNPNGEFIGTENSLENAKSRVDKHALSHKHTNEDYTHFQYKSGANPYIAKTDREKNRIIKKYKDKVKELKKGFYEIDDIRKDSFLPIEESKSKLLGDDIYGHLSDKLHYDVFASSTEDDAFEISKFKEENLQKAKDWCDENGVKYSIKQKVYSTSPLKKKFYMTIFTK